MRKPDDVSDEHWAYGKRAFVSCRDMEARWSDGTGPAAIARFIRAAVERERVECLKIIENTAQGSLQANLALSLAYETIKKRGEVK